MRSLFEPLDQQLRRQFRRRGDGVEGQAPAEGSEGRGRRDPRQAGLLSRRVLSQTPFPTGRAHHLASVGRRVAATGEVTKHERRPAGYHLRWLVVPACQVSLRHDSHAIVRYEGVVVIVIPVNLSAVTQRTSSESIILSKWIGHCIKKNRDGAVDQGSQPRHRQPHAKYWPIQRNGSQGKTHDVVA